MTLRAVAPSAGGGGGGTVTSVSLADGSTTPIFGITGSPVTTSGALTETLLPEPANTVFAGPASGAAAQPTFRALVSADIPNLGANPTASVGLTAVNGSATTYLRSDGAPPLSQAIVPTWTGVHTFSATAVFNNGFTVNSTNINFNGLSIFNNGILTSYIGITGRILSFNGATASVVATTGSISGQAGGPLSGSFTSGTTGTLTVVITLPSSGNVGWNCFTNNETHPVAANLLYQSADTSTSVTLTGTTVSGDVIVWSCPLAR